MEENNILTNSDIDVYLIQILAMYLSFFTITIYYCISYLLEKYDKYNSYILSILSSSSIISIIIIMTGVNNSELIDDLLVEFISTISSSIIGFSLIILSNFIFSQIFMNDIKYFSKNISSSVIYSAISISSAILIKSLIIWVDNASFDGIKIILLFYVINEILFIILTKLYNLIISKAAFIDHIVENKLEFAILYSSYRIGISLSLMSCTSFVPYDIVDINNTIFNWLKFSFFISLLYFIMTKLINNLFISKTHRFNIEREKIIPISMLESTIMIGIAMIISSLVW